MLTVAEQIKLYKENIAIKSGTALPAGEITTKHPTPKKFYEDMMEKLAASYQKVSHSKHEPK